MTMHSVSRYPRNGQSAILCEGDLCGYEVALLENWTAKSDGVGHVDVWPCGTKTAIYGMSDAIGREVPVLIIEDRDHRTNEMAEKDCKSHQSDRAKRGVKICGWKTWLRSEIENYLIEPAVVLPIFSEVFRTTPEIVKQRLQDLLGKTACDQSLQITLAEYRSTVAIKEGDVNGVSRNDGRPHWSESGLMVPDENLVAVKLREVLDESMKMLRGRQETNIDDVIDRFKERSRLWKTMSVDDDLWRIDWAGKEILCWLRQQMAAEFGWPANESTREWAPIKWQSLSRNKREELDRRIERAIQKRLVEKFLILLLERESLPKDVIDEWKGIIDSLRDFHSASVNSSG